METETETAKHAVNPLLVSDESKDALANVQAAAKAAAPDTDPYAVSPRWSKAREYKKPFDYYLETSEQKLHLKRLDMGDLLKLGITEEMDFMTKALMTDTKPNENAKQATISAVMKAENFKGMEGMINKVCMEGVLKPEIKWPPMILDEKTGNLIINEEAKLPDVLYIDDIPFEERMELFSVIFDSEGLSTFRQEQKLSVGDMETVSSVSLPAD